VTTDSGNVFASNATALVTGKVTPEGAQTSYWYDYGTSEALGTRSTLQAVGSGWTQIPSPAYITGLSANTAYFFRLSAQNSYGTVNGATYSFTTNSTPTPAGAAPTIQTANATDVVRTAATLNGTVDPNSWTTSYWFEYGTNSNFGNATALQGAGSGSTMLPASMQISNLQPLTKYYFRLDAQNPYGTVNGAVQSFTTTGPAAPGAPSASAASASAIATSTVTLNARINPNGDQTTYWFEYSQDSLLGTILGATTHTQVAGTGTVSVNVAAPIAGLTHNTRYYYHVVAQNSYGEIQSGIINFTTRR
jgi:phosphodiesterase/alkaline phosphatase D-like protein